MALRSARQGWVSGGLAVVALALLVGAKPSSPPAARMTRQAAPPDSLDDDTFTSESGDFHFRRTRQGGDWELFYKFRGISKMHEVSCKVNIGKAQKLIDQFSYRRADRIRDVTKRLEDRAKKSGVFISYGGPSFSGTYDTKKKEYRYWYDWVQKGELTNTLDAQGARDERIAFDDWYQPRSSALVAKAESDFMASQGFIEDPDQGWLVNYSRLVDKTTLVLGDCIRAFGEEAGKNPEVLMNFFQAMPYEPIEDEGTGWMTGGMRVPSSVLLQNAGDCDSKAVTFCVLLQKPRDELVIFRAFRKKKDPTRGHAFVGVGNPFSGAKWTKGWPILELEATKPDEHIPVEIRADNRYWVPCEVTGPERTPYGMIGMSKDENDNLIVRDRYMVYPISGGR